MYCLSEKCKDVKFTYLEVLYKLFDSTLYPQKFVLQSSIWEMKVVVIMAVAESVKESVKTRLKIIMLSKFSTKQ